MKKKSLILLPLLLVSGVTALAGCEKEPEPEVEVEAKVTSVSFSEDVPESLYMNAALDAEYYLTVATEGNASKDVTWTSSNTTIATVSVDGAVTGLLPGEVTITATSVADTTKSASFTLNIKAKNLPTPKAATIAQLKAKKADDTTNIYEVTGIVTGIVNSVYGNYYLSTTDGADTILVYGSTLQSSSIAWNAAYTEVAFTNPQDFKSEGGLKSKIEEGSQVTLICVYKYFNNTPEIMGYVKSTAEGEYAIRSKADVGGIYSASVTTTQVNLAGEGEPENLAGGATISKESGIVYGEEITVTTTEVAGYEPVVSLNGLEISPTDDNVFKFNAGITNVVTVTYQAEVVPTGNVIYQVTDYFAKVVGSYGAYSLKKNGITWDFTNAGYAMPKSSDIYAQKEVMLVIKSKTAMDQYFTITTKYDITGATINALTYGNSGNTVTYTLEYWDATANENAGAWVAVSGDNSSFTMTDETVAAKVLSGTFAATKQVRVHANMTASTDKNNRLGIADVTLTYPTAE